MATEEEIEAIRAAALANVTEGVQSASFGDESVTAVDPMKQLDVADRLAAQAAVDVAVTNPSFGLRHTRLISPGGWS